MVGRLSVATGGQRQGVSSELEALHENYDRKYGRPRKMNDARRPSESLVAPSTDSAFPC